MIKAVVVHEVGEPGVMHIEEVEMPKPGPGEALVRNHAIGLNYIDTYFRSGAYPPPHLPFVPGNEGAGEVIEVGKGVKEVKVGDRVAYTSPLGAYAEATAVKASRLVRLPKAISYKTGAAMMLKGLTAQYLLRRTHKVKKGDTILVHAAAGGVGLILCQWGKALGAHVIGTVGSAEKAKLAKKAGAKHVILYREENFVEAVKKITKGKLCDVVYDGVGKDTFPGFARLPAALGPTGQFWRRVRTDRKLQHRHPGAERLALCHPADAQYLCGEGRGSPQDGARSYCVVADGLVKIPYVYAAAVRHRCCPRGA